MAKDAWKTVQVNLQLYGYEFEAAHRRAVEGRFFSVEDFLSAVIKTEILRELDSDEVPFLPAKAAQELAQRIKGEGRGHDTDPEIPF